MVQLNYIQELKRQARGRNLSNEWYRKKIQELENIRPQFDGTQTSIQLKLLVPLITELRFPSP